MSTLQIYKKVKVIDAPIDKVFNYFSKMEHMRNWSSTIENYTFAEGDPAEYNYAGQTFRVVQKHKDKTFSADAWVEEIRPPFFIDVRNKDELGISTGQYEFHARQNQTEMRITVSAEIFHWYHSFLYRLAKPGLKRLYNKEFRQLNDYAIKMSHR
ncbi:MAG TPA: hypothetical protein DCE40_06135 [Exiguobacterium sp.]|nr:hypothetical protein [Exiguobacterium sp.]